MEGTAETGKNTMFARIERVEKEELFPESDPRAETVFAAGRISTGYLRQALTSVHVAADLGMMGSVSLVPGSLKGVYGDTPLSASLFVRARLK